MNAGKIVAIIGAVILVLFGALMVLGATNAQTGSIGWLPFGIGFIAVGLVIIFLAARQPAKTPDTNVTLNVDLPGNVKMDTIKCKSCGGTLSPEDITMVAGAPMVTCPYCHTSYQLTEEPKW
jgi:hypothetical protein